MAINIVMLMGIWFISDIYNSIGFYGMGRDNLEYNNTEYLGYFKHEILDLNQKFTNTEHYYKNDIIDMYFCKNYKCINIMKDCDEFNNISDCIDQSEFPKSENKFLDLMRHKNSHTYFYIKVSKLYELIVKYVFVFTLLNVLCNYHIEWVGFN